ncbi:MAG: hypothetical protein ACTSVO_13570 [Candidatus Heimdallarchaeaceae archaeon]
MDIFEHIREQLLFEQDYLEEVNIKKTILKARFLRHKPGAKGKQAARVYDKSYGRNLRKISKKRGNDWYDIYVRSKKGR